MSKAVSLTRPGNINLTTLLSNFSLLYSSRYGLLDDVTDLHKAVEHMSQVVALTPKGHPDLPWWLNNLSISLSRRCKRLGKIEDLNQAIEYMVQAVSVIPQEHSEAPRMHESLGHFYSERSDLLGMTQDALQAVKYLQIAAESSVGSLSCRFRAALEWASICDRHNFDTSLAAYGQMMALLPQLVWLESSVTDRYRHTRYVGRMTTKAAGTAIRMKDYGLALEWLEEGRSIVWKQMLQLRTPFDDLSTVHPTLAEELKQVAHDLDNARFLGIPSESTVSGATTSEETAQKHRRLAEIWGKLVEQARQVPGFNAFLRPRQASGLMRAARSSPVVVINVQNTSCDALVVQPGATNVTHIPLKFSYEKATKARVQLVHLARSRSSEDRGFKTRPGLKYEFGSMLAMLWYEVVMPVLDSLGYLVRVITISHSDTVLITFWLQ